MTEEGRSFFGKQRRQIGQHFLSLGRSRSSLPEKQRRLGEFLVFEAKTKAEK